MTGGKSGDDRTSFIKVDSDRIEIDRPITFDVFIYLEKNQKFVHWMREGSTFTVDRREKLKSLGMEEVYVKRYHEQNLLAYLNLESDGTVEFGLIGPTEAEPDVADAPQTGKPLAKDSDLILVKGGGPPQSDAIKVFGAFRQQTDVIHVTGSVATKENSASAKPAGSKRTVDVDFLNSVIKSIQQVFQEQFLIEVKFRPPTKRSKTTVSFLTIDVASFISLTSRSIRGTIGLCFPSETYRYLLSQATATEYESLGPDLYTGCGEFLFAIYETARPKLIELGYTIDRAVPILAIGESLSITDLIPDNGFSIVFDSVGGPFQFDVGIKTTG